MQTIDFRPLAMEGTSLKQQLVAAVANGDEMVAQELRLLLKMNAPELLRGSKTRN